VVMDVHMGIFKASLMQNAEFLVEKLMKSKDRAIIIIIIQHLYSAIESEDTEALSTLVICSLSRFMTVFLLFFRRSYLQLLFSDLHKSLFLISRLPARLIFAC